MALRYTLAVTAVHDAQVVAKTQETYGSVLTHFRVVNGTRRFDGGSFSFAGNACTRVIHAGLSFESGLVEMTLAWCTTIRSRLEPLMAHVVKQMSLQPSAILDQIWQNTVLRGAYAEYLAPSWLEVIKALSGGKVQKFASHVDDCVRVLFGLCK